MLDFQEIMHLNQISIKESHGYFQIHSYVFMAQLISTRSKCVIETASDRGDLLEKSRMHSQQIDDLIFFFEESVN